MNFDLVGKRVRVIGGAHRGAKGRVYGVVQYGINGPQFDLVALDNGDDAKFNRFDLEVIVKNERLLAGLVFLAYVIAAVAGAGVIVAQLAKRVF